MNPYARPATLVIACSAVLLAAPRTSAGQQAAQAFETLRLDLNLVANVNRNTFHEYWSPDPGVELNVAVPFYFGTLEAGFHYASFDGKAPEQPDFVSLFPYVGWSYDWRLAPRLDLDTGMRLGSLFTRFERGGETLTEQEFGIGLGSRFRYAVAGAWSVDLAAEYRVLFTHERMRLLFIAGGISRSFTTPRWLREFLE